MINIIMWNYVGHLYQDRYLEELIDSDSQMLDISRYIHLNPVKANIAKKLRITNEKFVETDLMYKCRKEEDEMNGIGS